MPSQTSLLAAYAIACLLTAFAAGRRGRSASAWCVIALAITPLAALIALWFLPHLVGERERTREFINDVRKRRHRRDPHDAFSRTRDDQEHEIQAKASTVRLNRQWLSENPAPTTRILRARENRTPATVIMDPQSRHATTRRRVAT